MVFDIRTLYNSDSCYSSIDIQVKNNIFIIRKLNIAFRENPSLYFKKTLKKWNLSNANPSKAYVMIGEYEVVCMTIRYPNGQKYVPVQTTGRQKIGNLSYSNRGKTLEDELSESNEYYLSRNIAVIHKKPVPIQVVNVNYPARSAAVITEAYFRTPSTTDFNGVWQGKYIDFEAKETKNKTSFPLQNIHDHQVQHMESVTDQNGITFLIVRFSSLDRYFIVPYTMMKNKWDRMKSGGRKSITLAEFEENAIEVNAWLHAETRLFTSSCHFF